MNTTHDVEEERVARSANGRACVLGIVVLDAGLTSLSIAWDLLDYEQGELLGHSVRLVAQAMLWTFLMRAFRNARGAAIAGYLLGAIAYLYFGSGVEFPVSVLPLGFGVLYTMFALALLLLPSVRTFFDNQEPLPAAPRKGDPERSDRGPLPGS